MRPLRKSSRCPSMTSTAMHAEVPANDFAGPGQIDSACCGAALVAPVHSTVTPSSFSTLELNARVVTTSASCVCCSPTSQDGALECASAGLPLPAASGGFGLHAEIAATD